MVEQARLQVLSLEAPWRFLLMDLGLLAEHWFHPNQLRDVIQYVSFPHKFPILILQVYIHTDKFLNIHVPDTYTVVTVQVVLDQRLLEKQWDVGRVFW